jgi:hypothetical protein
MKTRPTGRAGHDFERFTGAEVLPLVRRRARRVKRLLATSAAMRPTFYPARLA